MSRTIRWIIAGAILAGGVLAACTSEPTPTPAAPTSQPEPTPTEPAGDWSRIQAAGVLQVGTAADYPPFESYDETGQLQGFDIALITELAARLGLQPEIHDFAFDGLGGALQVGQIDAAIAALSVTPERQAELDFSSIYYSGQDGILMRMDSPPAILMATDLAGLRIGVQRGSVYATWASQNLVDPGWISESDLFVYDKPENAVRDLKESRLDAVMLDLLPAQQAVADGGVRLAGYGLASQQYAIAVKKGAALTGELNTALAVMETDGTISRLMEEYLHRAPPSGPVQPTPPLLPPAPCVDAARFIQDLTYDDGNMTKPPIFEPGQIFQKGWRLENTGTCTWDPSTRVAFARGNVPAAQMYGVPAAIPGTVAPGGSVDVFVNLVSPLVDGTYQGFWQLVNPASVSFGEVFWVGITVSSGEVIPTPDPQGAPTIKSFRVEPSTIVVNECVTVRWKVAGDTDRIVIEDNTGKVLWGDAPREGKLSDCLATAGAFGYTVTARGPGGTTTDTDKVNVVNAGPSDPSVLFFSASPQKIKQGECTGLSWTTTGASAAVALLRDGTTPAEDLPENGDYTDCPRGTGTQVYKLTAASPSSTVARSVQVIVEEDLIEPR